MPTKRELEEIDRIVDRCLSDKAKAAELKRALHADFERAPKEAAPEEEVADDEDDGDDLWDNVPV